LPTNNLALLQLTCVLLSASLFLVGVELENLAKKHQIFSSYGLTDKFGTLA
jgi:hypothetical protein